MKTNMLGKQFIEGLKMSDVIGNLTYVAYCMLLLHIMITGMLLLAPFISFETFTDSYKPILEVIFKILLTIVVLLSLLFVWVIS